MSARKTKPSKKKDHFEPQKDQENRYFFKLAFWITLAIVSLFIVFSSIQIGIPSDEPIDNAYGEASLDFYTSFGRDTSFADLEVFGQEFKYQKYYGAGFEVIAAALIPEVSSSTHYKMRHLLVSFCGIAILLFAGLTCKILAGWETGLLAIILLSSTPTITGHMLFNSKDIPFAMGFTIAIYFMVKSALTFPKVRPMDLVGLVLGIAIAVSIRIGGLLLVSYFSLLLAVVLFFDRNARRHFLSQDQSTRIKLALVTVSVVILGPLLGLLFYPNFWVEPGQHVWKAFNVASDFPARITMLFEGELINSTSLPDYYLIKSLCITLPVHVLTLVLVNLILLPKLIKRYGASMVSFLFISTFFPIAYVWIKDLEIYNGWRHLLFFYPTLIVLLSLSLREILFLSKRRVFQYLIGGVFALLVINTMVWQVLNYRYQYAYYNEVLGGAGKAYERFDNDYQQLGVSEAVKWLIDNEDEITDKSRSEPIQIASNNAYALNMYFDTSALNVKFGRSGVAKWKSRDWDYAAMSTIFVRPEVRDFVFPPKDLMYLEEVDGFGVAYLVKRKDRNDIRGQDALLAQDFNKALDRLSRAYEYDPDNADVWLSLGYTFASIRNGPEAVRFGKKYLDIYANSWEANFIIGLGYLHNRDYKNSEQFLLTAMNLNPDEDKIKTNLIQLYTESNQPEKVKVISDRLSGG